MKPTPKKKSPKSAPEQLRIDGTNTQIVQFMDYPDFSDPQGRHILVCSLKPARLTDEAGREIVTGQILVRINCPITPAALTILSQLMQPYKGYFVMIVNGTYTTQGSTAEVYANDVPWTNVQPDTITEKAKHRIVPVGS